jgi:hypothetical protein
VNHGQQVVCGSAALLCGKAAPYRRCRSRILARGYASRKLGHSPKIN